MQPLFTQNPLDLGVWVASLLIWRVMEAIVDIRTFKRFRAGTRRQDKGSHVALICLIAFGILLGLLLADKVPAANITGGSVFLFWLGIFLIDAGIALRLYAIIVLGAFFTTTVAVAAEQTVIETGPYRLIRPPSYIARIRSQLDELVEPARHHGVRTDWLELPHPCGRARPQGASGPALSGVYAAHETAHPLCTVTAYSENPRRTA